MPRHDEVPLYRLLRRVWLSFFAHWSFVKAIKRIASFLCPPRTFWCEGLQSGEAARAVASGLPAQLTTSQVRHLSVRTGFVPGQAEPETLTSQCVQPAVAKRIRLVQTAIPRQYLFTRYPLLWQSRRPFARHAIVTWDVWGVNPERVTRGRCGPLKFLKA